MYRQQRTRKRIETRVFGKERHESVDRFQWPVVRTTVYQLQSRLHVSLCFSVIRAHTKNFCINFFPTLFLTFSIWWIFPSLLSSFSLTPPNCLMSTPMFCLFWLFSCSVPIFTDLCRWEQGMATDFILSVLQRDQKWFLKEARETIKMKTISKQLAISQSLCERLESLTHVGHASTL